jgi:hypothetical protein
MGQSTFGGPLRVGDKVGGTTKNVGTLIASQSARLVADGTNAVSATLYLPKKAVITEIFVDVIVAFDSATSATLTVGETAGGTEYASGVNCKTGIRVYPTHTRPQLVAMNASNSGGPIIATVTPTGATTTGEVKVTVQYVMV